MIHEQLITEQETLFGSKPSPIKTTLSSKKAYGGSCPSLGGTTSASQPNRRLSLGIALMQPATPEFSRPKGVMTNSRLGASMGKDMKRERSRPAAALNYVALNKDELAGLASTGKHCYPISGYLACVNCKNSYDNKLINDGQPEYECHHILLCQP